MNDLTFALIYGGFWACMLWLRLGRIAEAIENKNCSITIINNDHEGY